MPSSSSTRAEPWIWIEERVERILEPADFELRPSSAPSSIARAVVIRHDLASWRCRRPIFSPLLGRRRRPACLPPRQQIARRAVERNVEIPVGKARALDDRLVIAGERSPSASPSGEIRTGRKFSSKNARASPGLLGAPATRLAGRPRAAPPIDRPAVARRPLAARNGLAAGQEGREGGDVIVVGPAVDHRSSRPARAGVSASFSGSRGSARRRRLRAASTERSAALIPSKTLQTQPHRVPHRCHCPASVATSFQLGSREETSRAKVQTSVTSVTLSGLPSITLPSLVAGHRDELRDEAHRDLRGLAAQLGAGDVGLSIDDEARLDRLALALALADRGLEAVIDLARQQILERAAVALGIGA